MKRASLTGAPISAAQYQALLERLHLAGVYGVITTGVVCAPGCAARAPLAQNVLVYPTAEAAIAEGFRPCKRCGGGIRVASSESLR